MQDKNFADAQVAETGSRSQDVQGPASSAPNTAPPSRAVTEPCTASSSAASAAAVPDDPVAWMAANHNLMFITKPQQVALRAFAAHYEAKGMCRAAEICERMQILHDDAWLTQSLPDTSPAVCYRAILAAAKEADR